MFQQLAHVVLPQAFAAMIQPLVNVFIGALIGTSLAAAVGVPELTNITQQLNIKYAEAVLLFLISGICYLVIALGAGAIGGYLQRRVDARHMVKRTDEGAAAVDRFEVEQAGL